MSRWLLPVVAIVVCAGVGVWLLAAPPDSSPEPSAPSIGVPPVAPPAAAPSAPGGPAARGAGLREELFSDVPLEGDAAALAAVAKDAGRSSRDRSRACAGLRKLGPLPEGVDGELLLGVVVDVPLQQGIDTVAIYEDGTARYVNVAGFRRRLDAPDAEARALTTQAIDAARTIWPKIAPGDRTTEPVSRTTSRFVFLVCGGDRAIVRAPDEDELGAILKAAAELLPTIISQGEKD